MKQSLRNKEKTLKNMAEIEEDGKNTYIELLCIAVSNGLTLITKLVKEQEPPKSIFLIEPRKTDK